MNKEIKILVVCSTDELGKIESSFRSQGTDVLIRYKTDNYKDALEIINEKSNDIDVIIIDGMLNRQNVLKLLNGYNNKYLLRNTIIIDNIKLECYNLSNSEYQVFNIIPKDYKISDLLISIKAIAEKNKVFDYQKVDIYDKISGILKNLGIAPDKNGFHYLRKAIYECYKKPELLTSITKQIYPLVSKSFSKKESCIERSIRSAIETGWDRGNYEYCEELFSHCLDYDKSKPTNGEFIAIIVDKLLLENGRVAY